MGESRPIVLVLAAFSSCSFWVILPQWPLNKSANKIHTARDLNHKCVKYLRRRRTTIRLTNMMKVMTMPNTTPTLMAAVNATLLPPLTGVFIKPPVPFMRQPANTATIHRQLIPYHNMFTTNGVLDIFNFVAIITIELLIH